MKDTNFAYDEPEGEDRMFKIEMCLTRYLKGLFQTLGSSRFDSCFSCAADADQRNGNRHVLYHHHILVVTNGSYKKYQPFLSINNNS